MELDSVWVGNQKVPEFEVDLKVITKNFVIGLEIFEVLKLKFRIQGLNTFNLYQCLPLKTVVKIGSVLALFESVFPQKLWK